MSGPPADYVDVAQRIKDFYDRYPEGSLQSGAHPELFQVGDKTYIAYCARAYRTPQDLLPGVGWAWEPVPGPTPFTRDSELQNAETSAWGRAIVALGFETKHIASADEVRNRSESSGRVPDRSPEHAARPDTQSGRPASPEASGRPDESSPGPTAAQHSLLNGMLARLDKEDPNPGSSGEDWEAMCKQYVLEHYRVQSRTELTRVEMSELIDTVKQWGYEKGVPFA